MSENTLDSRVFEDYCARYDMQPVDAIRKMSLDFIRGNILKYLIMYNDKKDVEDLKIAQHYVEILREQVMMRCDAGERFVYQFRDADPDVRHVMRLLFDHLGQLEDVRDLLEQLDNMVKKKDKSIM